jgi:hypothetical protein
VYGVARDEQHAQEVAGDVGHVFDRVVVTCSQTECIERL